MAMLQAFVQFDPDHALEQQAFLRSRTTVLRGSGGQCWVRLDEAQLTTLVDQGMLVTPLEGADVLHVGPLAWAPASETPQPPAALRATAPSGDNSAYWLVHFVAPVDKAWLQALALADALAVHTLDASSVVLAMTAAVAAQARALPFVDAVGLFHPAYVPALDLTALDAPLTAATLADLQLLLPPATAEGNLQLTVFEALAPASLRPALEAAGASVVAEIAHGYLVQVAQADAAAVLSVPGLLAASSPTLKGLCSHNAGIILGANQVRDLGTVNFLVNLDGAGEIGAVVDSGFDVGNLAGATPPTTGVLTAFHPDLAANMRLLANSNTPLVFAAVPDASPHGTHVAGIVAGDGSSAAGLTRGMAPRAALVGLGPLPARVGPGFDFAAGHGARVINNSWGSAFAVGVTSNRYTVNESQAVDRWCFDNPDVLVLFAAGNDETDVAAGGDGRLDARDMKLEATAKNALTIGASENLRSDGGWRDSYRAFFGARFNNAAFNAAAGAPAGAFSMSDRAGDIGLFSARGQVRSAAFTNTRRIKPDLVAPGTNVLSTRSQWVAQPPPLPAPPIPVAFYNNNSDSMLAAGLNRNLYQIFTGTSMATPLVSGAALLLRQYFRSRHGQLRRPLLLEGVALPAAPPLPVFGSRPAVTRFGDGLVMAWVSPELPADAKRIVALRLARHELPVAGAPLLLQAGVGDHAAPQLVTVAARCYLLHRHGDGKMRLSCYDQALAPVLGFGTAGVVTLAPDARLDDAAAPALVAVNDELVCVWPTAGGAGNGGFFQRFAADTGAAVDAAAVSLLFHDSTGAQHPLAWNGSAFTFCGVLHGATFQLQVRQIDSAGQVQGAAPITVLDQAAEIREPSLLWDPRGGHHALVWCDARNQPGGEVWMQFLDGQAAAIGAAWPLITLPAGRRVRRPRLLAHPDGGCLLAWEDDSQDGHFDLYLALFDANGLVDGRLEADAISGRRVLRLSDTVGDVDGYALAGDSEGFVAVYHSADEINADLTGVQALRLTRALAFEAQEDPLTPLQKSGRYVATDLLAHNSTALGALSAAWTGAAWDLLRLAPGEGLVNRLQWLRLNADGVPDARHGVEGVRELPMPGLVLGAEMLWNGNDRRLSVVNDALTGITVHAADADGAPLAGFGAGGAAALHDPMPLHDRTPPQLGFFSQPAATVVVGYGCLQAGVLHLRMQRLDARGVRQGQPADLATADGVAPHQWFQFVNGEGRAIAIYHRAVGADMRVLCRRFLPGGLPDGVERSLSAAAGEARNGVLARRPTAVNSANREYGAVWQYRASAAAHWEIRFSRLDRLGQPLATPPVAGVVLPVADITLIGPASADWSPSRDAVEPQLLCTYHHEPWASGLPAAATAPEWSPAYGLAWIGVEPGGQRILYFTMLDENGQRLAVPQPPVPGPGLQPRATLAALPLSTPSARVQEFKLVWNGRVFMLFWAEEEAGQLRLRAALVNRHASPQAYALPSAALLRATLVGGATNLTPGPLPDVAAGYGWGRVNLRQCLAPAQPVTLQVRDDCAIGPGRRVIYHFSLPAGTALLRVTLNWTDPPGPQLVNHLHLTVRTPGALAEFRGNLWDSAAGRTHLSRAVATPAVPADSHEDVQTFKQVVLANPAPGEYEVEVAAAGFAANAFNQQNLQPFALVFAGSGPEMAFNQPLAAVAGAAVY